MEAIMPIKKITDFQKALTGPNILLSCQPDNEKLDLTTEMSIHYNELPPGGEIRPHVHNRVEVYLFLTGRAKVMTGDQIEQVTTGDVAIAPIGTAHAVKVLGDEPLRFYAFNSPPASTCPMKPAPEEIQWKWDRS
jgi:mannose-6-phosphate isomerase-like protein (cupin superfamily)